MCVCVCVCVCGRMGESGASSIHLHEPLRSCARAAGDDCGGVTDLYVNNYLFNIYVDTRCFLLMKINYDRYILLYIGLAALCSPARALAQLRARGRRRWRWGSGLKGHAPPSEPVRTGRVRVRNQQHTLAL